MPPFNHQNAKKNVTVHTPVVPPMFALFLPLHSEQGNHTARVRSCLDPAHRRKPRISPTLHGVPKQVPDSRTILGMCLLATRKFSLGKCVGVSLINRNNNTVQPGMLSAPCVYGKLYSVFLTSRFLTRLSLYAKVFMCPGQNTQAWGSPRRTRLKQTLRRRSSMHLLPELTG